MAPMDSGPRLASSLERRESSRLCAGSSCPLASRRATCFGRAALLVVIRFLAVDVGRPPGRPTSARAQEVPNRRGPMARPKRTRSASAKCKGQQCALPLPSPLRCAETFRARRVRRLSLSRRGAWVSLLARRGPASKCSFFLRRPIFESDPGIDPIRGHLSTGEEGAHDAPEWTALRAEFRLLMIGLVRAGRSPDEVAAEFAQTALPIRNWVAQADREVRISLPGCHTLDDVFSRCIFGWAMQTPSNRARPGTP